MSTQDDGRLTPEVEDMEGCFEIYAEVSLAMERAFIESRARFPQLGPDELLIALLLLKDRVLERYVKPTSLSSPELRETAQDLYDI